MRNQFIVALLVVLIASVFFSCEKRLLKDNYTSSPTVVFEHLWEDLNKRYTYFEEKGINRDSLYQFYKERVNDGLNQFELFDTLTALLFALEDGHVNLTSSFDRSRNWEWFQDYPLNFNENILRTNYLKKDFRITGPFTNKVIDSVLYVRYSSFMSEFSTAQLNQIITWAKETKGIVLDIRHNGGGQLQRAERLAGAFTSTNLIYGKSRYKSGAGVDEFTPWNSLEIPAKDGEVYTGSVVVLTNRSSYSSSSFFALMAKALPNVTLMGDQTGGGGGVPVYGELPNGWRYRFSGSQTLDLEGNHIEFGVPVDISVTMTPEDEAAGVDALLEAAIGYIKSKE
jgi:hypothetical protein